MQYNECPLSLNQLSIFLNCATNPNDISYNIPCVIQIMLPYNKDLLVEAINEVANYNNMLRAKISVKSTGETIYCIGTDKLNIEEEYNIGDIDLLTGLTNLLNTPFELYDSFMVRFYVIHTEDNHFKLVIIYHHIIIDDLPSWFIDALVSCYKNKLNMKNDAGSSAPADYKQFTLWQNNYLCSVNSVRDKNYWLQQLDKFKKLDLTAYQAHEKLGLTSYACNIFTLPKNMAAKVKDIARNAHVSLFSIFLSCLFILQHKITRSNDLSITSTINQRPYTQFSKLLGVFTNQIIFNTTIENISYNEFNKKIWKEVVAAIKHGRFPFLELAKSNVDHLSTFEAISQQIAIVYHDNKTYTNERASSCKDYSVEFLVCQQPKVPLMFEIIETNEDFYLLLKYCDGHFSKMMIEFLMQSYVNVVEDICRDVNTMIDDIIFSSLPLRNEVNIAVGQASHGGVNLAKIFEDLVNTYPNEIAIETNEKKLTYQELNESANQLCHYLYSNYLKHNRLTSSKSGLVGIFLDKGIDSIIAIIGIVKAGLAYVPIDVHCPVARLQYIINDSNLNVLVTSFHKLPFLEQVSNAFLQIIQIDTLQKELDSFDKTNPEINVASDQLAYVIYTSGTTGNPKGVLIEHKGVVNLAHEQGVAFAIEKGTKVLQFAPLAFDASVSEIWCTLLRGGTLCIPQQEVFHAGEPLSDCIKTFAIEVVTLPPSILSTLPINSVHWLKTLIVAGEAASQTLLDQWVTKVDTLINAYGPTESTVCASMHQYHKGDLATNIGKPLNHVDIYLLDELNNKVANGDIGDIYIAGINLARGYLNNDKLTSEKFILLPQLCNKKLYKTGDRGRYLPGDNIEFLGRADHQIKIRGFRVEVEEIESIINKQAYIQQCAIIVDEYDGEKILVAFIVIKSNNSVSGANDEKQIISTLKIELSNRLPNYMLPNKYIVVESFALTSNGKIDRKYLAVFLKSRVSDAAHDNEDKFSKRDEIVQLVADTLSTQVTKINTKQSFLMNGGSSLSILRLISNIKKKFDVNLSIQSVFAAKSIENIIETVISDDIKQIEVKSLQTEDMINHDKSYTLPIIINNNDNLNSPMRNILLTGVTGFLGSHLLMELLRTTEADICCIIRSSNHVEAEDKFKKTMEAYNLKIDNLARIRLIAGDISQQMLGIETSALDNLSHSIDTIYHCAANVNHIYQYELLRNDNVLSTVELIRFAAMNKIKKINYISTIDTVADIHAGIDSECQPSNIRPVDWGYIQTKWVSENILHQSSVPFTVYRLGNIMGHSQTGIIQPDKNHFLSLLKGCLQLGVAPHWESQIEMTPVDIASACIVGISKLKNSTQKFYNLHATKTIRWLDYIEIVKNLGFKVRLLPFSNWKSQHVASINESNALFPFKNIYLNENISEFSIQYDRIKNYQTRDTLNLLKLNYTVDYHQLIKLYIGYLLQRKYLTVG